METNQEVTAQGRILHRSGVSRKDPLAKINLGDADIYGTLVKALLGMLMQMSHMMEMLFILIIIKVLD